CKCGEIFTIGESRLLGTKNRNPDRSCGCMKQKQNGYSQTQPRIYHAWMSMLHRCNNPKNNNYNKYGAKGITVCKEWEDDFEVFMKWSFSNGYKETLTLDRVDSKRGYSPHNCRWATYHTQAINKGLKNTNTTGHTGVAPHPSGKYRTYISRNGKKKSLGLYENLQDAVNARRKAEILFEETGQI
ncbi:MAG TPA: hypothetical protein VFC70_01145, partial [Oscillospiraceae bacterium]|nr:hypothetical protein [Oscillospiraceae bacterium]